MDQTAQACKDALFAQAKHQRPCSVDAGQGLVSRISHASQASHVIVLYTVIVMYHSESTPLPYVVTQPYGAATPPSGVNESHKEEYESVTGSKLGGTVKRLAGDGA